MGKNKDRLLTKSIPWADSILEQVINLPAAGGEDLQSTAEAQVLAVENLLKMVNRKVAENRGEGQYVWKKYSLNGMTIQLTHTVTGNPSTWHMSADGLNNGDYVNLVGVTGKYNSSYAFNFISKTQVALGNSGTEIYPYTYDPDNQNIVISASFGNTLTLTDINADVLTFIDFAVSDDESAYPNGGEQDGYWYELVDFSLLNDNVATGTFSLSVSKQTITVAHGLGKKPTGIFGFKKKTTKFDTHFDSFFSPWWYEDGYEDAFHLTRNGSTDQNTKAYTIDENQFSITSQTGGTNFAGGTWYWVVFAV